MSPSVAAMLVSLVPLWMSMAFAFECKESAEEVGLKYKEFPVLLGLAVAVTALQAAIVAADVFGWW